MLKKVLFVDRDGTVLVEPPDEQVDSLEKLAFMPFAISSLKRLQDHGYELVMVTNQEGRGTPRFPEERFLAPHNKMLDILKGEGVTFARVFVDATLPEEKSPTRKPGIGMIETYLAADPIDLERSYVVGDRHTDVEFARNIGCKSVFLGEASPGADFASTSWIAIADYLTRPARREADLTRTTKETRISAALNLDGSGRYDVDTGLNFLNHLIEQFARHAAIDLTLSAKGDLHVDAHHTIEDTAIVLGDVLLKALGDKRGIRRYGFFMLPTDEAIATCALDFSGRAWLSFEGKFGRKTVGDFPSDMIAHWLKTFSDHAGLTLHVKVTGSNAHHQLEAIFKALGRAVQDAVAVTGSDIPTTKGTL